MEKATLRCLPMMQNLQRSSLQYLIPDGVLLLCTVWRPRSLMCPRRMCQSHVAFSFSVAAKASPTIMLPIILYKLAIRSPLRIVIVPMVTLIPPSEPENLHPWASKTLIERRFFLRSGIWCMFVSVQICLSNILIRCCQCQLSCTRRHCASGQSLHQKTSMYWTTLILGTCSMYILSQVNKHLSTFSFLTELSRHQMILICFFDNTGLFLLSTSASCRYT